MGIAFGDRAWAVRRALEIARAGHRSGRIRAFCRPARDLEQVRRQAPAVVRLEHVVLQDEMTCVRPVIGELMSVVVSHEVRGRPAGAPGARGAVLLAALDEVRVRLAYEAIHLPAVDVVDCVEGAVRAADVAVVRIVEGTYAPVRERIGDAHRRPAVLHRKPVRAREGAEVRVERAVLLHDHDHLLDRVDARPIRRRGHDGRTRR